MSRSVATLVVTMQGDVETEVLGHILVVSIAEHIGVVP